MKAHPVQIEMTLQNGEVYSPQDIFFVLEERVKAAEKIVQSDGMEDGNIGQGKALDFSSTFSPWLAFFCSILILWGLLLLKNPLSGRLQSVECARNLDGSGECVFSTIGLIQIRRVAVPLDQIWQARTGSNHYYVSSSSDLRYNVELLLRNGKGYGIIFYNRQYDRMIEIVKGWNCFLDDTSQKSFSENFSSLTWIFYMGLGMAVGGILIFLSEAHITTMRIDGRKGEITMRRLAICGGFYNILRLSEIARLDFSLIPINKKWSMRNSCLFVIALAGGVLLLFLFVLSVIAIYL